LIYNYEFEALIRRGFCNYLLDELRSQMAAPLWRGIVHCRKVVTHREVRAAARAAATQSFLHGMDLSFLKPPPDYLAGMTFSMDYWGRSLPEE
jgi:hypothetical protein